MCWGGKSPAFACANGTGTREPYEPMTPDQVRSALPPEENVHRIGNHGYVMDPPHIPTYSHDQEEPWAYYEYGSFLCDRHMGRGNAAFLDGHVESLKPETAYRNNRLWNSFYDTAAVAVMPDFPLNRPASWQRDPP